MNYRTKKIEISNELRRFFFTLLTASVKSVAWTEHTSHRFGGLREPHPRFTKSKVAFHTKNALAKRVAQLAEGALLPSFSVVTGTGPLNQKLRM